MVRARIALLGGGVSVLMMSMGMMTPATAQEASTSSGEGAQERAEGIQDIVVTAQRREESAQKVPISITVIGSDALGKLQSTNDIGQLAPNVQVETASGFGIPRTGIRGISQGDFNANSTTSNMIYLDDVPLNATIAQGIPIWDLGRAEILRGPQGTLFGRNATGGAIRYIAEMPTSEFEGYANVTLGRFQQRGFEAAFSGPLSDTLGVRLSVVGNERDGDVNNVTLGEKQGKQSYYGVRGIIQWKPTDTLTAVLRAQYFNSDVQTFIWKSTPGPVAGDAFGPAPSPLVNGYTSVADLQQSYGFQNLGQQTKYRVTESDVRPNEHLEHVPVSLNVDLDLGFATLTSVTGFLDVNHSVLIDNDGTPAPILTEYDFSSDRQWSQELRLTSNSDGPFNWIAGAFYLHEAIKTRLNFDATAWRGNVDYGFPDADTVLYTRGADQDTETYAGFLHTTYDITPELKANAAIRYTYERKDIDYIFRSQWEFPSAAPRTALQFADFRKAVESGQLGNLLAAANAPVSASKSYKQATWKLGLDYQITPRTLLYAYVARGFKGGSFKPNANTAGEVLNPDGSVLSVRPEIVTDYEVGFKADAVPGKLRLNGGLFYYDYRDYQTNQIEPSTATQILSNLPKSRAIGAELEISAVPVPGLNINLGLGYLDTKITKSLDPNLIGNKLPYAQDFNVNGSISYDIDTPIGTFTPEFSGKRIGRYYTTKENDTPIGRYTLLNARIGFESIGEKLHGSLWVKNLTNKVVPIAVEDASEFFGSNLAYVNARRTFGATFGVRF